MTLRWAKGSFISLLLLFGLSLTKSSLLSELCDRNPPTSSLSFEKVDFVSYVLTKENCGEEVSLSDVNSGKPPSIQLPSANLKKDYQIVMVDPDAPGCQSWLHWIEANIKGSDLQDGTIDQSGVTIKAYNPPTPPPPRPHRYFIFVFEEGNTINTSSGLSLPRCGFNIDDYATNNGLKAVAMNMFVTESNLESYYI